MRPGLIYSSAHLTLISVLRGSQKDKRGLCEVPVKDLEAVLHKFESALLDVALNDEKESLVNANAVAAAQHTQHATTVEQMATWLENRFQPVDGNPGMFALIPLCESLANEMREYKAAPLITLPPGVEVDRTKLDVPGELQ